VPKVRSAVIEVFHFTPQGRPTKQSYPISSFVSKKDFQGDIIDVKMNLTIRKGDIVLLNNVSGFADGQDSELSVNLTYK